MLSHAFKEWAVVCKALAEGVQTLILRKGGILEIGSGFQVEHDRFWLIPTYTHQQAVGIVPWAEEALLKRVEADNPQSGLIHLSHFAEVREVYSVLDLDNALALEGMHIWSPQTVIQRFHYRRPGLFVLTVRVFKAVQVFEVVNAPVYDGCKTWVQLECGLPTAEASPVLSDAIFREKSGQIGQILA